MYIYIFEISRNYIGSTHVLSTSCLAVPYLGKPVRLELPDPLCNYFTLWDVVETGIHSFIFVIAATWPTHHLYNYNAHEDPSYLPIFTLIHMRAHLRHFVHRNLRLWTVGVIQGTVNSIWHYFHISALWCHPALSPLALSLHPSLWNSRFNTIVSCEKICIVVLSIGEAPSSSLSHFSLRKGLSLNCIQSTVCVYVLLPVGT